jgi:hypothetical protein
MYNPEKLATQGTQDKGQQNTIFENRKGIIRSRKSQQIDNTMSGKRKQRQTNQKTQHSTLKVSNTNLANNEVN